MSGVVNEEMSCNNMALYSSVIAGIGWCWGRQERRWNVTLRVACEQCWSLSHCHTIYCTVSHGSVWVRSNSIWGIGGFNLSLANAPKTDCLLLFQYWRVCVSERYLFLPVSAHYLSVFFSCRKLPPFYPSLGSLWTSCQTAVTSELTWATTSITGSTAAPRLPLTSPRQQAQLLISCCSASSAAIFQRGVTAPSSTFSLLWICSTRATWLWRGGTTWWCLSPCQRSDIVENWFIS